MKWTVILAAVVIVGVGLAAGEAVAATAGDVKLPAGRLPLDHACMAVLWSEMSEVSEGYDPQYTAPEIDAAIKPWTDDAAAAEGISPEDEGSSQATMDALENLTGDLQLYLKQVAFCVENKPPTG